jgi:hypothetical protein
MLKDQNIDTVGRQTIAAIAAFSFILLSLCSGCATSREKTDSEIPRISVEELSSRLDHPLLIVIDVRSDMAWKMSRSKIKGAVRKNSGRVDSWAALLPKDRIIVTYCT